PPLVATDKAGVRRDQSGRFNPHSSDVNYGTYTITLPYDAGIATDDKVVYSSGGGIPIGGLGDGGVYYAEGVTTGNPTILQLSKTKGGAVIHITDPGTDAGRSHSIVPDGHAPTGNGSDQGPREISVQTDSARGVAVTATNSDDIAGIGIAAGFSGTASVNLSGVVDVVKVNTSAYIGRSAKVNCGLTCASNVASADPLQSVRVAAANQFHELGVAASLAIGGTVGVGVGIGVHLVTLNTDAYIDDAAQVNARNDITVGSKAKDTIISIVAGASGGEVGV